MKSLYELEPAALALYAGAVLARLDDPDETVRNVALVVLDRLKPATLAQYANAIAARLEDSDRDHRELACVVLAKLAPASYAQHASAVIARLFDSDEKVRYAAAVSLAAALPPYVARNSPYPLLYCPAIPATPNDRGRFHQDVRSQLLGRLTWYKCRLRLRVKRLAQYWYALPYRPSGPGHARDVAAWAQMYGLSLHNTGGPGHV